MLEGSQGQTWDLQVVGEDLIAGNNAGSIVIRNNQFKKLFSATGVYTTLVHPESTDILLQGTYTGVIVLKKDANGEWQFSSGIDGFFQSAQKIMFDEQNRLWVLHPRKGMFRLTLDEGLSKAVKVESFGKKHGLPSEFTLDITRIGKEMIVKSDSAFFTWNERQQLFVRKDAIGGEALSPGNFRLMPGREEEWFKVYPTYVQYIHAAKNTLRIPLPSGNEHIASLSDSSYLFCLDDGYIILPKTNEPDDALLTSGPPPLITGVAVENSRRILTDLSNVAPPFHFAADENQLKFFFACPNYSFPPAMRFRLLGFDEKWSPFQSVYSKEYTNLPPGNYEFQVQSELTSDLAAFHFTIEPKWYQTRWARICYFLLVLIAVRLLLKWHRRRLEAQKKLLQQENERKLEQQRMEAKNEMLQAEVLNKSRKLADTTMNLVRKNEMLMKIKEELDHAAQLKQNITPAKAFTKMEHLIDEHLTSDEDWQVFEANFNQLHDQFFKRLKDQYPELTPGDLRLAAYLKMNLSSKEIAPLLNISLRGVENKRYRLRLKMGLGSDVNLTEYLMSY